MPPFCDKHQCFFTRNTFSPTQEMHCALCAMEPIREERRLSVLLHRLWSKAVGTHDYVKAEWMALAKRVETGRPLDQPERTTVTII